MDTCKRVEEALGVEKTNEIVLFMNGLMKNRGVTQYVHNQLSLLDIPAWLKDAIFTATGGRIDVNGKRFALEAGKLYHEKVSHSDEDKEALRGQKAYSENNIFEVIETMLFPDIIEGISYGDTLDQRKVFAVEKYLGHNIIIVLSVGGNRNPNVTPQQIVYFNNDKWITLTKSGMTMREILYGSSKKRRIIPEELNEIKSNRVTVAHYES